MKSNCIFYPREVNPKYFLYLEYPIKLNTLQLGISKNFIDRRFHISPPGKTTQHVVNDYYEESNLSFDLPIHKLRWFEDFVTT